MKNAKVKLLFAITVVICMLFFAVASYAAEGYLANAAGEETNIKWILDENGVLSFSIDGTAVGKVQSTQIINRDPLTGAAADYKTCLPTYAEVTKIIVGDGITSVEGFASLAKLETVELAESVATVGRSAFASCSSLHTIYIKGKEPQKGTFDLSHIKLIDKYAFDGCKNGENVILAPDYTRSLPADCLKNMGFKTLEIPEGTAAINNNALSRSNYLEVLTILGMKTSLESDNVFKSNTTYPKIKAKAGSKAEAFAKANGYTFIDLDTGEETKGTKPLTDASKVGQGGATSLITEFKPEGATLYGHSSGTSSGSTTIDIWWAYYDDTKTLEFVSGTTGYNETGTLASVDKQYESWEKYKDEIEHIIIGDYIKKITKDSFTSYTSLIDVRLGNKVNDIGQRSFRECPNLVAIWRDGTERVEGQADLSNLKTVRDIFKNNKITEVILPKATTEITVDLLPGIVNLYAYSITDALKSYCEQYYYNLININNPEERYDYWFYIDPTLPTCGLKSVYSFDEATGTLTVSGAGSIDSITNYYGGGSRNQPWRALRDKIKHIVIGDGITSVGKYAFCELKNVETVEIPNSESFEILNAAFEKCHSLKSLYRRGEEPIVGTLDLRNVHELPSWSFAYTYLIANVVISPNVESIGTSVFEENITLNLKNVYGVPGSYAQEYAKENNLNFFDVSAADPEDIICIPPETTLEEEETKAPESEKTDIETESETAIETEDRFAFVSFYEIKEGEDPAENETGDSILPIIIAAAAAAIIIAAIISVITLKKKKK